jgi:3-oxoacyl-[acyl-carrier protein] reductase
MAYPGALVDKTEGDFDGNFDINARATFLTCREVIPQMIENRYGRIVNFSSGSEYGGLGAPLYGGAKAAVSGMSRGMAVELGPHNITVNVILPGLIDTPILAKTGITEEVKEWVRNNAPLRRLGEARELAAAACFLASDDASYVTGEQILVNGGVLTV